jgi:hypothetical protein
MLRGLVDALNCPSYLPPPLFVIVPSSCPVEVTKTCSVAFERELEASTLSERLDELYWAFCTLTVSAGADGLTVSVAERVTPPETAVMVTVVDDVTDVVATPKLADEAPAGTVTLAATPATALLDESSTTVGDWAGPLSVTVPCEAEPPMTEVGFSVTDASVTGGAGAGLTVNTAVCVEPP